MLNEKGSQSVSNPRTTDQPLGNRIKRTEFNEPINKPLVVFWHDRIIRTCVAESWNFVTASHLP